MKSMHIKGTFAGETVDITITADVDPKAAAAFLLDFYEAAIDQVTESRASKLANKAIALRDVIEKTMAKLIG